MRRRTCGSPRSRGSTTATCCARSRSTRRRRRSGSPRSTSSTTSTGSRTSRRRPRTRRVRQRARKIVDEIQEAERAKQKPVVPDEVKRRRAEKAQLIREVEPSPTASTSTRRVAIVEARRGRVGQARRPTMATSGSAKPPSGSAGARSSTIAGAQRRRAARSRARGRARARARALPSQRRGGPRPRRPDDARGSPRGRRATAAPRGARAAQGRGRRAACRRSRPTARRAGRKTPSAAPRSRRAWPRCARTWRSSREDPRRSRDRARCSSRPARRSRRIGKVPADQRDALADRYTAARGKLVDRVRASCARPRTGQRFQNVPKAEALIATAKEMARRGADAGSRATDCASSRRCGKKSARCRSAARRSCGSSSS